MKCFNVSWEVVSLFGFHFIQVLDDDPSTANATLRERLTGDDPHLTSVERQKIRQFLEAYSDDE